VARCAVAVPHSPNPANGPRVGTGGRLGTGNRAMASLISKRGGSFPDAPDVRRHALVLRPGGGRVPGGPKPVWISAGCNGGSRLIQPRCLSRCLPRPRAHCVYWSGATTTRRWRCAANCSRTTSASSAAWGIRWAVVQACPRRAPSGSGSTRTSSCSGTRLWDPTGRWYRTIRALVLSQIESADGHAIDASSAATFYFVRGDSALIRDELKQRGFAPDSSRWYIRRWEDETDCRVWGVRYRDGVSDRYLASTRRPLSARSSARSRKK